MDADQKELEKLNADQQTAQDVLEKQARAGERWENWVKAGHFAIVDELFSEVEQAAFLALRLRTFNIEDKNTLYQYQANLRAVDIIRQIINERIEAGRAARTLILQNSTPQEAS